MEEEVHMSFNKKWTLGLLSLATVLVLGVSATTVYAQTTEETPAQDPAAGLMRPDRDEDHNADLSEALGISVEELEAAQIEARNAAIDQAVADGQLTQEQADQMKQGEARGGRGWGRFGGESDYDTLLAEALGITVEQLETAQQQVKDNALAEAVASGQITQEEADLIQARQDLQEYLRDRLQSAYEEGVQQAVTDGVITQEQADQILSEDGPGFFGSGFHGGGHWGGPGGGMRGDRQPGGFPNATPPQPESSTPQGSSSPVAPSIGSSL
jgi:hypothetical protein